MKRIQGAILLAVVCGACHSEEASEGGTAGEGEHPDAVVVDFFRGDGLSAACSGTLVSPTVVLTAAHCADASTGARVTGIAAGGQGSDVAQVLPFDWSRDAAKHDGEHDLAVLILRTPIRASRYASVSADSCEGCDVVAFGRTHQPDGLVLRDVQRVDGIHLATGEQPGRPFALFGARAVNDAGGAIRRVGPVDAPVVGVAFARGAATGGGYFVRLDGADVQVWIKGLIASEAAHAASSVTPQAVAQLGLSPLNTGTGGQSGDGNGSEDGSKPTEGTADNKGLERVPEGTKPGPYDNKPKMRTGNTPGMSTNRTYQAYSPDDHAFKNDGKYLADHRDVNYIDTHGAPGYMDGRPSNEQVQDMAKNGNPIINASCNGNTQIPGTPDGEINSNSSQIADDAGISRDQVWGCQGGTVGGGNDGTQQCEGTWSRASGAPVSDAERRKYGLANCTPTRCER